MTPTHGLTREQVEKLVHSVNTGDSDEEIIAAMDLLDHDASQRARLRALEEALKGLVNATNNVLNAPSVLCVAEDIVQADTMHIEPVRVTQEYINELWNMLVDENEKANAALGQAENESELDGNPEPYMVEKMRDVGLVETLRAAVRATKKAIAQAIRGEK